MKLREYTRRYALSGAGAANLAVAAVAGAVLWMSASPAAGILAAVGAYAVIFVLALATGIGPKAAAAEAERRAALAGRERLEAARKDALRLSALRVPDPGIKSLVELAGLKAGSYLAACARSGSRDPRAEAAIADCLELADAWLKELDDSAVERRFRLPDDDPFADGRERVAAGLRDRVAILDKAALDLDGGLGREDRVSIKEQL